MYSRVFILSKLYRLKMEGYVVYVFLGVFLVLSLLIYANLLVVQFFGLRFASDEKRAEQIMHLMLVLSISFMWYAISLSFTLYNKWLLQEWHSGFHFPIMITMVHMTIKYFVTRVWALTPDAEEVPPISWKILSSIVIPIGVCTSADIVFSNIAVYYLPLSMYTTIKGATLVFTYSLGIFCGLEEFKWSLFAAVLGIAGGLGLAIASSSDSLSFIGLLSVTLSAAASAVRWVLMQLLAVKDERSDSVMVTLYRFSPYSALSIIPFALAFETPALVHSSFAHSGLLLSQALLFCIFGGVTSFLLLVVEVKLLRVTSSLTMCVIGQIKEIIQILAAMVLFKDHINLRSGVGILLSIAAAYWYRTLKSATSASDGDLDEQRATMQILQSSALAHRGVRGLGLHAYSTVDTGPETDVYLGLGTCSEDVEEDEEDEEEGRAEFNALLFMQENREDLRKELAFAGAQKGNSTTREKGRTIKSGNNISGGGSGSGGHVGVIGSPSRPTLSARELELTQLTHILTEEEHHNNNISCSDHSDTFSMLDIIDKNTGNVVGKRLP